MYAIEAALHGAEVVAIDVRSERMDLGAEIAARHGLDRIEFRREDALGIGRDTHGGFDVVYALGLIYHLDWPQQFELLERIPGLCEKALIVDTVISVDGPTEFRRGGRTYRGERQREHADEDPAEVRRSRLLRSLENTFAVRLTRQSLARALGDAGFTCVLECLLPAEPGKGPDRVTMAALAGEAVELGTYPWINRLPEEEIGRRLGLS